MVGVRRASPGMGMLLEALLYLAWAMMIVIMLQVTAAQDERTVPLAMALVAVGVALGILSALGLTLEPKKLRPSISPLLPFPNGIRQSGGQRKLVARPERTIGDEQER